MNCLVLSCILFINSIFNNKNYAGQWNDLSSEFKYSIFIHNQELIITSNSKLKQKFKLFLSKEYAWIQYSKNDIIKFYISNDGCKLSLTYYSKKYGYYSKIVPHITTLDFKNVNCFQ